MVCSSAESGPTPAPLACGEPAAEAFAVGWYAAPLAAGAPEALVPADALAAAPGDLAVTDPLADTAGDWIGAAEGAPEDAVPRGAAGEGLVAAGCPQAASNTMRTATRRTRFIVSTNIRYCGRGRSAQPSRHEAF